MPIDKPSIRDDVRPYVQRFDRWWAGLPLLNRWSPWRLREQNIFLGNRRAELQLALAEALANIRELERQLDAVSDEVLGQVGLPSLPTRVKQVLDQETLTRVVELRSETWRIALSQSAVRGARAALDLDPIRRRMVSRLAEKIAERVVDQLGECL